MSQQLENGVLSGGAQSRPKRLEFRLIEMAETKSWAEKLPDILAVQVKILATATSQPIER
jgi:hypothetical protein